ncbi:HipA N-terminal domain-containing protein [Bradyrhizobium zhanjiangense]|uniref:HipA N-terminal subdomain 1 domain-containing protein n=1 Tax=Bradyrhizobium zhanjiangense TaxID=1325107 RepID=A0A4Q0Q4R3_9BRAD|nr:hypothetical protein EAS61_41955 [Bradyrhizobium zhanjiangense]
MGYFTCARSDWKAARHQIGIPARDHWNPHPPLAAKKHTGARVANYLWNLLPDNDQTLQKWGTYLRRVAEQRVRSLSKVGEDCAGAIQIVTDEWMVRQRGFVRGVQWTTRRRSRTASSACARRWDGAIDPHHFRQAIRFALLPQGQQSG